MKIKKWQKALCWTFLCVVLLVMYIPVIVLMIYSFTEAKSLGQWTGFSLELYQQLFTDSEIMGAIGNSLILALVSAVLATAIGTISAIGIHQLRNRPKKVMEHVNRLTMVNADIVTSVAFMLFFLAIKFIPDGWATLIIAHTVICIPYVVLSVMPRLSQLNPNLYEAGQDLGAGPMRVLFTVLLPQLIGAMLAGFMLSVTISLDDFVIANFNGGSEVQTISVYLYAKLKKGVQPVLRAMSTLILVVIALVLVAINIVQSRRNKKVTADL